MAGFVAKGAGALGKRFLPGALAGGASVGVKDLGFDDGDEVGLGDYISGSLFGGLMGGGRSLGRGIGSKFPKVGPKIGWGATGVGGLGMLGTLGGGGEGSGGMGIDGLSPLLGGLQSLLSGVGAAPMGGEIAKDPLWDSMYGGLGGPPSFSKTFSDYMKDAELGQLADDQIIRANAALARENKDTRIQMAREVGANDDAGQTAIDRIGQIRRENAAQNQAVQQHARTEQQRVVQAADDLAGDVGASIIADDKTRHDVQAEQANHAQNVAARQSADSTLLERLATASQDALGTLSGAEAQATRANANNIRTKANEAIATNRAQASDNWLERSNILGSLADTALQRDLQAHQMGLQSWGARLDAVNAFRQSQLERQKLQGGQMDPQMLNLMLSLGNQSTGNVFKGAGADGQQFEHKQQAHETWAPEQRDMMNNTLAQMFGLPQGFTFFAPQAVPEMKEDKFGFWR